MTFASLVFEFNREQQQKKKKKCKVSLTHLIITIIKLFGEREKREGGQDKRTSRFHYNIDYFANCNL